MNSGDVTTSLAEGIKVRKDGGASRCLDIVSLMSCILDSGAFRTCACERDNDAPMT
jgi:hypothetical protein